MYLNQLKTRAGLNYNYIAAKNSIIISGCASGGYYNNIPPHGSTYVWPPVFCKSVDTNWEVGNQMGIMELENESFKIYPNPINDSPLTIMTSGNTQATLRNAIGSTINSVYFKNRTTLDLSIIPSGVYFLELEFGGNIFIKKIIRIN